MEALSEYAIPVQSLKLGEHSFDFELGWEFFSYFEESPVKQGKFMVNVLFDKQADHWQVFFTINGKWDTECDRCLAPISLPVEGQHWLIAKFEEEDAVDSDVVFVSRDERNWNIAQFLYEFVLLSVPVTRMYDCESEKVKPCDDDVLKRLEKTDAPAVGENPLKEALKEIQKNL